MNRLEKEWSSENKVKTGRKRKGSNLFALQIFMRKFSTLIIALSIEQHNRRHS